MVENNTIDGSIVPENTTNESTKAIVVSPAVKPEGLNDKQVEAINQQVDKSIKALVEAKGANVFSAADQITNIGVKDQKDVSTSIALLQEKMGNVFGKGASTVGDNVSRDITDLQKALVKINPRFIQKEKGYKIIAGVPLVGEKIVDILRTASNNRMTLQQFVDDLKESLEHGDRMLREDNAQLKTLWGSIESSQNLIKTDQYMAEVLMEKLQDAISNETDAKKKGSLQNVLFKVSTRAQDFTAMENINEQFFVSIEMTIENNNLLIDSVRRMLTMGINVVNITFAIHSALERQKRVIDVQKKTKDFLGNMILENARTINAGTKEIGDLYKEPIIAMNKLEEACAQLEQAVDATNKLKAEGIEVARNNIAKIKVWTEELKTKAGQLPDTEIRSLEASKVLSLPVGQN